MKVTTFKAEDFGIKKFSKQMCRAVAITTAAAIISVASAPAAHAFGLSTMMESVAAVAQTVSGGNTKVESAIDTALLGAGVGALTGHDSHQHQKNALYGAGAGAVVGAVLDHKGREQNERYAQKDRYGRTVHDSSYDRSSSRTPSKRFGYDRAHPRDSQDSYYRDLRGRDQNREYRADRDRFEPTTHIQMKRVRVIENDRVVSDQTTEITTSDATYRGYNVRSAPEPRQYSRISRRY